MEVSESYVREFVARTVVLPLAKKFFGKNLKALLLVGSSQQGVRKASKRPAHASDLDVRMVVSHDYSREGFKQQKPLLEKFRKKMDSLSHLTRKKWGFDADLMVSNEIDFDCFEPWRKEPFQVLYGKATIDKWLSTLPADKRKEIKNRKMPPPK